MLHREHTYIIFRHVTWLQAMPQGRTIGRTTCPACQLALQTKPGRLSWLLRLDLTDATAMWLVGAKHGAMWLMGAKFGAMCLVGAKLGAGMDVPPQNGASTTYLQ